jgi:hypothetical protein
MRELFPGIFSASEVAPMAAESESGKGFTVQDRRRFSPETGEAREDSSGPDEAPQTQPQAEQTRTEAPSDEPRESLPAINFSTFIISLSTQALMHLGEIADPQSGKTSREIPVAKQLIDIIGMLKEKTKGNLDGGEDQLVENILYDLRMRYVEAVKKK